MAIAGPGVPGKLYGAPCGYIGVQATCSGALVAVDIGGSKVVGFDEAEILVKSVPSGSLNSLGRREVVPVGVGTWGPSRSGLDARDKAVSGSGVEEDGKGADSESSTVHLKDRGSEY